MKLSARPLKVNFAINLLVPLLRVAVALVTIPVYIRHIGEARYGVISIVWVLLGSFGFLDLGLSRAATNALAKLQDAPQHERARVLLTTFALNSGLGLIGGASLFIFGTFLLMHIMSVPEELKPEIARSFPWIAGLFPMTLVLGVAIGALESRERFLLANVLQTSGSTISLIAPLVAAILVGPSLTVVIPVATAAQAANVLFALVVVHRLEGPFDVTSFDKQEARGLLRYGGWISVSSLVTPLVTAVDQLVIGSVLGVAAVAHYAVPMNLVSRSQIFPFALMRTFFPRMSSLPAEEAKVLASRAFTPLAYIYAAVCAPAIVLAPAFFRYWISGEFAEAAAPVGEILFLGAWINGLALVALTFLHGQGRVAVPARIHLAEVVPFLAVLWCLTSTFGTVGAAIAWSLRCTADGFLLFWVAGISRRDLLSLVFPATILGVSVAIARLVGFNHLALALAAAVTTGLLAFVAAWMFSEEWRRVLGTAIARLGVKSRSSYVTDFVRRSMTRG